MLKGSGGVSWPYMPERNSINAYERLTGGGLLVHNTVLNFIGQGVPLVVAIFAIPVLVKGLGIDRFGVLTLAWMVVGYFSLFDFGTGRALTKFVAEKLGAGQEETLPALVRTSLLLMLILGVAGAVVFGLFSPWLVRRALNIPMALQTETLHSFYVLALAIPAVITTAGIRGVIEAKQRFGFINALRIGSGLFSYLAPVLVLFFSKSLFPIVAVLAASRLLVLLLHWSFCLHVIPALRRRVAVQPAIVAPLLRFGGWITVSNIVSPLMVYVDRFLVAGLVSVAAVAYYVTPYSVVTNLLLVPSAIAGVLFPAFATSFVQDPDRTQRLFARGVKYVFLAMFPMALLLVAFGSEGLDIWLGKDFAQHSTRVLQLLTVGVLVNSLAYLPFSLVQSAGRPDLTAKLHLVELPFYLLAVWWATRNFGIVGTAVVWSARVTVDALILFRMARRVLPRGSFALRHAELPAGLALLVLALGMVPNGLITRVVFVTLAMLLFLFSGWFVLLNSKERGWIHNLVRAGSSSETGYGAPEK